MEKQVYQVKVTKNSTEWCNAQGQLHRLDGPALEYANGNKQWYQNGQLHRLDGPAGEWADGTRFWYQNGQLHRIDGPAIEHASGYNAWYQNGQLHRLDGPAGEWVDGTKQWYINGQRMTEQEFLAKTQHKELTLDEIAAKFGIPVEQLKIKKG